MRQWIYILLIVFVVALSFYSTQAMEHIGGFGQNSLVGQAAPDFTLTMLDGKEVNFTEYRSGQKTIIFFWATWCPHCQGVLKKLNEQKAEFAAKGIKVALVDTGESIQDVKSHLKNNNIDLPVFVDEQDTLAKPYGIVGIPTVFFVNQHGVINEVLHELPDNYEEFL